MTEIEIRQCFSDFFERCKIAESIGGLRHQEVIDRGLATEGFWFDHEIDWWIPETVSLFYRRHK